MTAAERIPQIERLNGSGRQPAHVEALRDAEMDTRAARLDHRTTLNDQVQWAYRIGQAGYVGAIDRVLDLCGQMQREARDEIDRLGRR